MSWSLPGWSRQPGTFQLVLGYGEKEDSNNPSSDGSHSDSAPGAPETSNDEKADAASKCKIRVQLEWGAAEDEEGVVLRLQSQLMMALPYPEEEVHVRMVPPSEAAQLTSDATSPSHKRAHSHPPTTPDTNPKPSPGQGNSGDASPSSMTPSSSWGFLDRLAYSIGRNSNAGDIVVSSPDVKATSAPTGPTSASIGATSASTGSASAITGNTSASMELTSAHMASTSAPTGHDQAPGTKTDGPDPGPASIERPRSHEDVHSDNEHFEDAPHHFPASLDTAPADHAGATPGSPEAVSSGGRVPIRTVVKRPGERLRVVLVSKTAGSGVTGDGLGVLNKLVEESELSGVEHLAVTEGLLGFWMQRGPDTWHALRTLDLSGCNLTVVPPSVAHLPALEVLLLDNNKLVAPPAELGKLTSLKRLSMDHNLLLSVPIELRECTSLTELSLEHNRLVRPLLDFRSMARTLQTLRLFGNPLEFLPEILPCRRLRRMSLANVRIEGDPALTSVEVYVEDDAAATSYYFAVGGTKHRLSTFFQLVFRYSSCQHPLLASALARIAEDGENRAYIGRDEGAIRQLLSMVLSDDTHVVQQACRALSSIAMDTTLVARLVKADVLQSIWAVLGSNDPEIQVSVLQVLACVAFCSNSIAARLFTPDMLHRLKELCGGENTLKVREEALLVLGNLAFSPSNRRAMASAQGLRSLLAGIALTVPKPSPNPSQNPGQTHLSSPNPDGSNGEGSDDGSDSNPTRNSSEADGGASIAAASPARAAFHDFDGAPKRAMATEGSALRVRAAAVRALAIMGENELVRKATGRRPVGSRGVKILSLDGGGQRVCQDGGPFDQAPDH